MYLQMLRAPLNQMQKNEIRDESRQLLGRLYIHNRRLKTYERLMKHNHRIVSLNGTCAYIPSRRVGCADGASLSRSFFGGSRDGHRHRGILYPRPFPREWIKEVSRGFFLWGWRRSGLALWGRRGRGIVVVDEACYAGAVDGGGFWLVIVEHGGEIHLSCDRQGGVAGDGLSANSATEGHWEDDGLAARNEGWVARRDEQRVLQNGLAAIRSLSEKHGAY
jgi:hypothetical protein